MLYTLITKLVALSEKRVISKNIGEVVMVTIRSRYALDTLKFGCVLEITAGLLSQNIKGSKCTSHSKKNVE